MSKIKVIPHEEATGRLKEVYDDLVLKRGKLADVHTIQSLRPESIIKHMDLYMEIMFSRSELSRAEREMIAVIVPVNNDCEYCQIHHAEALNNYWKNDKKIANLKEDFNSVDLNKREFKLCEYAKELTLNPGSSKDLDLTKPLRDSGIEDSGILDATLVIAYFNFVNRIVLGLGVNLEPDSGKGYKY